MHLQSLRKLVSELLRAIRPLYGSQASFRRVDLLAGLLLPPINPHSRALYGFFGDLEKNCRVGLLEYLLEGFLFLRNSFDDIVVRRPKPLDSFKAIPVRRDEMGGPEWEAERPSAKKESGCFSSYNTQRMHYR